MTIRYVKLICIISCMFLTQSIQSQQFNLSDFQWKNRLLLVIGHDETSEKYIEQLEEFNSSKEELNERRLLIIEIQKDRYRIYDKSKEWIVSKSLFKKYSRTKGDFEVLLIGLDGGVKVRKNDVVKVGRLNQTIDSMPMRISEMRSKNE